jgi:hypothetical protein
MYSPQRDDTSLDHKDRERYNNMYSTVESELLVVQGERRLIYSNPNVLEFECERRIARPNSGSRTGVCTVGTVQ